MRFLSCNDPAVKSRQGKGLQICSTFGQLQVDSCRVPVEALVGCLDYDLVSCSSMRVHQWGMYEAMIPSGIAMVLPWVCWKGLADRSR